MSVSIDGVVSARWLDGLASPRVRAEARAVLVLRVSAVLCLLGWAWQHLRWDVPYREILWSPAHVGWLVRRLGFTWADYVGTVQTDQTIAWSIQIMGLVLVGLAFAAITATRCRWTAAAMALACGLLLLIAYCKYLDHLGYWAQGIEYAAQISAPLMLVLVLYRGYRDALVYRVGLGALVLTFIGHGLYAVGYFPTPGSFTTMVMTILGVNDATAWVVLHVAGILDLVVCVAVFVPRIRVYALGYAAAWGLLTALARPVAGMRLTYAYWGVDQYVHETLYRAPHFLLPLFLILALQGRRDERLS